MDNLSDEIMKQLLPLDPDLENLPVKTEAPLKTVDHCTHPVLLERAAYLRKLAKLGDGSASETLKEYPQHSTMLSVRLRSGIAELHENFADLFIILEGKATLVTGGTVLNPTRIGPGEVRGDSVEGGTAQELRPGDIAHVAAGTPHQMLLTGNNVLSCMVVKIQELP